MCFFTRTLGSSWFFIRELAEQKLKKKKKFLDSHMLSLLCRVRLFVTPWTIARQAPPSIGFSRQEYWSGLPFPPPGDLPNPGIEPGCLLCLLYCRRIVYPLSHERNGDIYFNLIFKTVLTESAICHCRMDI